VYNKELYGEKYGSITLLLPINIIITYRFRVLRIRLYFRKSAYLTILLNSLLTLAHLSQDCQDMVISTARWLDESVKHT
jgi:hypothetical protein